jgi:hypothetical protein
MNAQPGTLSLFPYNNKHIKLIYFLARCGHLRMFTWANDFYDRYRTYFAWANVSRSNFAPVYIALRKMAGERERTYHCSYCLQASGYQSI